MNIVLLGPQGSGKGTQAQLLAEKYGLTHISTGDLIREGVQKKDPVAMKIKEHLDKGKLAPDKYVIKLVKQNLSEQNAIDGFPRTLQQAEALDEIIQLDLVIEIKIPDDESVKRLSARRQCKQCRAIFGTEAPPRKKDVCNRCGGELFQREDDKPEAIKKRLEIYHEETEPLLEYYKPRKIVHSVDGTKSIEDVFKQICDVIEKTAL
ncbi:MAG TPA: adenylate kinase [Candidatus Nanoarchaeia archaeon]|nr:adenylate kinase [Candidatus Nanoarchaeia archaeon]